MTRDEQNKLDAADLNACEEWQDGEGAAVVTTTGIWFAALAYERARVAKAQEDDEKIRYEDQRIVWEMTENYMEVLYKAYGQKYERRIFPLDIKL